LGALPVFFASFMKLALSLIALAVALPVCAQRFSFSQEEEKARQQEQQKAYEREDRIAYDCPSRAGQTSRTRRSW
jgi:uncharacterized membrane protein